MRLPVSHASERKVNTNLYNSINQFLQLNMFTLQLLPKQQPQDGGTSSRSGNNDAEQQQQDDNDNGAGEDEEASSMFRAVLREQIRQLSMAIDEATRERRLDDVRTLQANRTELQAELQRIE